VAEMLNSLAMQGARVVAGRTDNLHVSGHAYQVGRQQQRQHLVCEKACKAEHESAGEYQCSCRQSCMDFTPFCRHTHSHITCRPYPPAHSPTHLPTRSTHPQGVTAA
jgi:hypothetical protein